MFYDTFTKKTQNKILCMYQSQQIKYFSTLLKLITHEVNIETLIFLNKKHLENKIFHRFEEQFIAPTHYTTTTMFTNSLLCYNFHRAGFLDRKEGEGVLCVCLLLITT